MENLSEQSLPLVPGSSWVGGCRRTGDASASDTGVAIERVAVVTRQSRVCGGGVRGVQRVVVVVAVGASGVNCTIVLSIRR